MADKYPVSVRVPVRFSDTDAMGHINNASYITFLEEGRVAYLMKLLPDVDQHDPLALFPFILADIQCSFKAPAYFGETLLVSLSITEIGTKSFVAEYEIHEEKSGRLCATARSVQVMYDYTKQKSLPIPDDIRQRIAKLEKASQS